jgi:hypothetical protein
MREQSINERTNKLSRAGSKINGTNVVSTFTLGITYTTYNSEKKVDSLKLRLLIVLQWFAIRFPCSNIHFGT